MIPRHRDCFGYHSPPAKGPPRDRAPQSNSRCRRPVSRKQGRLFLSKPDGMNSCHLASIRKVVLVFGILGAGSGCSTVGPGHVAVLWRAGNGTQSNLYGEGSYSIAPWNGMYVYDLRSMNRNEVLDVLASNGLSIKLDASVRYHLNPDEVVALQKEIGPGYYETIIEPVLRSEARRVFGRYTPEEIYSTKRDLIEREIREGLRSKIEGKHSALAAVLLRNVELRSEEH